MYSVIIPSTKSCIIKLLPPCLYVGAICDAKPSCQHKLYDITVRIYHKLCDIIIRISQVV